MEWRPLLAMRSNSNRLGVSCVRKSSNSKLVKTLENGNESARSSKARATALLLLACALRTGLLAKSAEVILGEVISVLR